MWLLLSAILLALAVGAVAGGALPRLADLRLRWVWLLGAALALRLVAGAAGGGPLGSEVARHWGLTGTYLLILAWLWGNWRIPGLQVAAVGVGMNTVAVFLSGGLMPVWDGALAAAGLTPADFAGDAYHYLLPVTSVADLVRSGGIFGDVVPVPLPVIRDVVSLGDLLLAAGIFWAIVGAMVRPEAPLRASLALGSSPMRPFAAGEFQTGVAYATAAALAAEAPLRRRPGEKAQSPYLALAANRNYSLLWVGQLVSLMGDRVHQVALGVLVAQRGSPLDVGLTFAATAAPSILLGPLAGALADRFDRRRTMIACDLLRAGLVLLVPVVIEVHIALVYLVAFGVATVSLLFRPAKDALVPLVVPRANLLTANSATSVTETLADLLGYPLAGLLVAALAGIIGAAFVIDSATYLVSALLLAAMAVPAADRIKRALGIGPLWRDIKEGWRFLTHQAELRANTLVSTVAQVAVGTEVVCSLLYARQVLDRHAIGFPQNYSLLMAAIGLGSILGGLAIGTLASRFGKGILAIGGFMGLGLTFIAAGLVRDPYQAMGLFFLAGAANMAFIIPNITLFQERTPQHLFARVVSSRQALVFGVMAASMAVAGFAAGVVGPAVTLMAGGAVCVLAGVLGLFLPAMRQAA